MISTADKKPASVKGKEFHLLFAACFVVFLPIAIIAHFLPERWQPWPPKLEGYTSIIAEAKAAVHSFLPFAFMG